MNEIYELQVMLRRIAQADNNIAMVNPSGIYDKSTAKAVSEVQEQNGLPVTGNVDFATWNIITALFSLAMGRFSENTPVSVFPNVSYIADSGEISDLVMIIQLLLNALSSSYDNYHEIKPSGIYDDETKDAVRHFQKVNLLPQTGAVDSDTWDAIANSYNTFSNNRYYES